VLVMSCAALCGAVPAVATTLGEELGQRRNVTWSLGPREALATGWAAK
jgi:hypothetical protein